MVPDILLAWLLDADPALRRQVERDLVGEPPEVWEATRARIATEGFGARLLALQEPDGTWLQSRRHPGRVWFEVDAPAGEPSRWLTLVGNRVLAWWDGSGARSLSAPVRPSVSEHQ